MSDINITDLLDEVDATVNAALTDLNDELITMAGEHKVAVLNEYIHLLSSEADAMRIARSLVEVLA